MPNWMNRLFGGRTNTPQETKSFSGHTMLTLSQLGPAQWSGRGYASLVNQGFMRNPVVYRCVRLIAEAAKAAFSAYVKHGEEKALQIGVNADGGYVVPAEVETEITRLMTHISPIRAIAGVRQVSGSVYKRPITVWRQVAGRHAGGAGVF